MRAALFTLVFVVLVLPALAFACRAADDWLSARHEERIRQRTVALRKRGS